ncbi:bifunctional folylpolyglutamate synthase/dihydrofolate synthase [cyanobacterium endosymbiont of Epithemia clementina EcSB]|uniref:bifunctional folylpolyglutamate synthase/dihydrofolate synthase n=1 Tax=cyanobacterium endosymbiont of Epithemia clementina EcSB TaxID=3034674 RepID=UPI0024811758|nr:folylpolyglutamate synthase/dihydrofolate synthase family protein [cyanobacterium endosymbiont of Epithemia clementina EcSB]WGT67428.1 bifunctional folylpolyglutamate synthase/dihydrofolate synthase [cyanobacterium endosymbiont of Epithemia clementina EcSB]
MTINSLLQSFRFMGVNLGLDRIQALLKSLDNPHHCLPVIHVGGTNGKGSVCAYLSSTLTEAGYRVGRYTSPHLVDPTERICINNRPIPETDFERILIKIKSLSDSYENKPSLFEVMTATAWVYFAQQKVEIAVIEVGLGGRLDATNICNNPLVTIITSISREHWQILGPTLTDIAYEKGGILKPKCPAIIGQLPSEAETVIRARIKALNCPSLWVKPAIAIKENWGRYQDISYPLPLLGKVQLMNSALAIATLKVLQKKGWKIPLAAIQKGMKNTQWLGRLHWTKWRDVSILIDGAHNGAAATALRDYVDTLNKPITWVMGILSTKDHDKIFEALLRSQDNLYLVPVPDHQTANPEDLALLANKICSQLSSIKIFSDVFQALDRAVDDSEHAIILCGSLYLIGYFFKTTLAMGPVDKIE